MRQSLEVQIRRENLADVTSMRRWLSPIFLTLWVGVAYFLSARVSLLLMARPGVAVFWPAAGISAGILIARGPAARWPVAIGVVVATIAADLTGDRNFLSSGIFALSDAGEALLVAWIIERYIGSDFSLGRLHHVLGLLGAVIIGTTVSGVGGILGYKLGDNPEDPAWTVWRHWVASDTIGIVAVAPLVIGLVAALRAPPLRRELIEGIAATIAVVATAGIIIFMLPADWWQMYTAVVLLFPVVLWVSARCRPEFVAAAVFFVAIMVMAAVTFRLGNFGIAASSIDAGITSAQITIASTAFCAFIVSALFAERRQHETALQEVLAAGAVIVFEWDLDTGVVRRSESAAEILGLDSQQSAASFISQIHPDDLAHVQASWSSLNRDKPTCSIDYRYVRLDGREVWLRTVSKAYFDVAGRPKYLKGLARDITERKQANMRIAADLDAMKRLHRVSIECARSENELSCCLDEIVDAAIAIVGADRGNVRLFDRTSGALTIAAQRGFQEPFLKYFGSVSDFTSACGAAIQRGERVLIEDVAQNEIFIGTPSLNVLLDAGVRAVAAEPLISSSGRLLGVLATHFSWPHRPSERELQLLDLLARQAADYLERMAADEQQKILLAKLQDSEDRMRAIVNTAQNGIITIDDKGTIENLNPAAARIFGYGPEEAVGRNVNMLMPEAIRWEHDSYLNKYLDTGQANVIGFERELTGLRRNGSTFPMELTVSEITMSGRRMFVGVVHDITNRVRNAERQRTLMAELDHRVKNVLARVAMLAASTRKGSATIDKYVSSLEGRIQSMAVAHSLLSQSGWQNVGLGTLVRKQLAPYASGSNVTMKGEDIILDAAEIQAVAMVLHELVTNAAKYGALSAADGRVCITWDRVNVDAGAKLLFEWRELGGPPVQAEVPSGYGTSLIRDLIPHELGGNVDLMYRPDGVSCKIEIPLGDI